ncbi:MAG: glutathione S-transferase [Pseudomonadota bacterium]
MSLPQPTLLYESHRAPNPRRVQIFLAEKAVEIPRQEVDIMAGHHFGADYRDRIGTHHVPALELEDGSVLTETVAICRYIEALSPEPNLMGRDAREAAEIEMWQRRVEFQLLMPIAFVARHGLPAMQVLEQTQVPEWADANRPRVLAGLAWLDKRLQTSPFVAGDRFTIADITAVVGIDFMRVIRTGIPDDAVSLDTWLEKVRGRPSMELKAA